MHHYHVFTAHSVNIAQASYYGLLIFKSESTIALSIDV